MLLIHIPDDLRMYVPILARRKTARQITGLEICRALSILTALSFLPQLHRIGTQKTSKGVSTDYVFWNLLCATEQLKYFVYLLIAKDPHEKIPLVYDPPT